MVAMVGTVPLHHKPFIEQLRPLLCCLSFLKANCAFLNAGLIYIFGSKTAKKNKKLELDNPEFKPKMHPSEEKPIFTVKPFSASTNLRIYLPITDAVVL